MTCKVVCASLDVSQTIALFSFLYKIAISYEVFRRYTLTSLGYKSMLYEVWLPAVGAIDVCRKDNLRGNGGRNVLRARLEGPQPIIIYR